MAQFFRKVKNHRWWHPEFCAAELGEGQVPAGAMRDFLERYPQPVSVFDVSGGLEWIEATVAALVISKGSIDQVDYVIFDDAVLAELPLRCERTEGLTRDEQVNESHVDIGPFPVDAICGFIRRAWGKVESGRFYKREVAAAVEKSVRAGRVKKQEIPEVILDYVRTIYEEL